MNSILAQKFQDFEKNLSMKVLNALLLSVFLGLAACNNNQQTVQEDSTRTDSAVSDSIAAPVADTVLSGCYSMMVNRDTSSLQMQVKGNQATGSISYNLSGKDRNDGTFEGEISNDRLSGWYLFRSEGLMSVRQVVFRIGQGYLWPATGEVMERNDTAMFRDINKLSFDTSRAFVKVRCVI